jgi:hypothetical protein
MRRTNKRRSNDQTHDRYAASREQAMADFKARWSAAHLV